MFWLIESWYKGGIRDVMNRGRGDGDMISSMAFAPDDGVGSRKALSDGGELRRADG